MSAVNDAEPRVIVLTPYFRPVVGGVESNAERLALFLHAAGFGVTVLTKRLTRDLPDADATDHVRIERIGPLGPRSPGGKWWMLPAVTSWLIRHRTAYEVVCAIDCRGVGLGALAARSVSQRPVIVQPQTTGVLVPDGTTGPVAAEVKSTLGSLYARADAVACIARTIEREALARMKAFDVRQEEVRFVSPQPASAERLRSLFDRVEQARRDDPPWLVLRDDWGDEYVVMLGSESCGGHHGGHCPAFTPNAPDHP